MKNSFKIIDEKFESRAGAMRSYVLGFIFSILLTIIPYYIVTENIFGRESLFLAAVFFGIAQLFIKVIFFLHLHPKSRPHWNIVIFVYTIVIVSFLLIGSMWIMYHLNMNLMGVSPFHSNEGYIPQ